MAQPIGQNIGNIFSKPVDLGQKGEGARELAVKWSGARFLGNLVKYFLIIVFTLILFGLIVLAGIFVVRSFQTGAAAGVGKTSLVTVEQTGAPAAKTGIGGIWDTIWNPQKTLQDPWQSEVEKNANNEELGVKLTDISSKNSIYGPGDPIEITSTAKINSLKDKTTIATACDLEDYNGEIIPTDPITAYKNQLQITTLKCLFADGFKGTKELSTKFATLKADYDFITKATLKIYLLKKDVLDLLLQQNKDPFENLQEPLLTAGNVIASQFTEGPIDLGIRIRESQPLTTERSYHLEVRLANREEYFGNLKSVKSINLFIPKEISLSDDVRFCDFKDTGQEDETGLYKEYTVRDDVLTNKINIDCSKEALKNKDLTPEDCIHLYHDEVKVSCDIQVNELPEDGRMFFDRIKADADYVYETRKRTTVKISKDISTTNAHACETFTTESQCKVSGCITKYDSTNKFLRCETCPIQWTSCKDYNQQYCGQDPCNFGNCQWSGTACKLA